VLQSICHFLIIHINHLRCKREMSSFFAGLKSGSSHLFSPDQKFVCSKKKFFHPHHTFRKREVFTIFKNTKNFFHQHPTFSNFRFGKKIFQKNLRQTGMNKQKKSHDLYLSPPLKKREHVFHLLCMSFVLFKVCSVSDPILLQISTF